MHKLLHYCTSRTSVHHGQLNVGTPNGQCAIETEQTPSFSMRFQWRYSESPKHSTPRVYDLLQIAHRYDEHERPDHSKDDIVSHDALICPQIVSSMTRILNLYPQ